MPAKKSDRVASIIKKTISEMLTRDINDKDIGFCTVTDVDVTNDLSYAKVYVTFMGTTNERGLAGLNHAKGYIRSAVAKKLSTRKCPELIFNVDESLITGNRVDAIIRELNIEKKEEQ